MKQQQDEIRRLRDRVEDDGDIDVSGGGGGQSQVQAQSQSQPQNSRTNMPANPRRQKEKINYALDRVNELEKDNQRMRVRMNVHADMLTQLGHEPVVPEEQRDERQDTETRDELFRKE